jgi:hypothetical protein
VAPFASTRQISRKPSATRSRRRCCATREWFGFGIGCLYIPKRKNEKSRTIRIKYRSRVTSSVTRKHPVHPPPPPPAPLPTLPPNTATRTLTQRTPGLASSSTCTLTPTSPSNSPTAIQGVPSIGWVACSGTNLCASNCVAAWWYSR